MPLPKVSIIMPTYNRAAFIGQSIESIRQQTYADWELLVVDDGSDDNTEAIVTQMNDARIHFYKAGRTGIGGKIKNLGLAKAAGSLISFLDSDDLWAPEKLQKQVAALQQFPDAGFSLAGGYNFKEEGKAVEFFYKKRKGIEHGQLFLSFFQSQLPGFTQALLFRKECLQKTGLFREAKAFSDVDFIATIAYYFKGVILYEPLVFRRLHEGSYSPPAWIKSYGEGAQLIHDFKDKLPARIYRSALFRLYIHFGESCLQRRLRRKAVRNFLKAWQYNPLSIVPVKKTGKAAFSLFKQLQ